MMNNGVERLHDPRSLFSQARIAPLHEELTKEKCQTELSYVHCCFPSHPFVYGS
jgi:hypothetical protein